MLKLKAQRIAGGWTAAVRDQYLDWAERFLDSLRRLDRNTGTDLARDIQTGFLSRLSLTPMRSAALLAGQLGGSVVLGVIQACVYLLVGLAEHLQELARRLRLGLVDLRHGETDVDQHPIPRSDCVRSVGE